MTAPTVFHTPAYLAAYRRCFGRGKRFHRLRHGAAAAWLMSRGQLAPRLEWWGAGIHDIGGAGYQSPDEATALWGQIEGLSREHAGAHLAQVPADCHMVAMARAAGWRVRPAEACPVLNLPPSWEEYVASLGRNMREQIKRLPRRLEKHFTVRYELAITQAEVTEGLSHLFMLHGRRWRQRGQTGVLATPGRRRFHRLLCAKLLRQDRLRLWTLRCNDRPACVLLNYFHGGRYSFFIGGFEPGLAQWSVGNCLFARVIRAAQEEGATEFDFLRGEEEYKYRLGAVNRDYVSLSYLAPGRRGYYLERRLQLEQAMQERVHHTFSAASRRSQ